MLILTIHNMLGRLREKSLLTSLSWFRARAITKESFFIRRGFTGWLYAIVIFILTFIGQIFRGISGIISLLVAGLWGIVRFPLAFWRWLGLRPARLVVNRGGMSRSAGYAYPGDIKQVKWLSILFFRGVLLVVILVGSYFMSAYVLLSGKPNLENRAYLMALHQYRTAVAVRDKQGHLLGVMANYKKPPADYFDRDSGGNYLKGTDRESALYVDKVPTFFWDVLVEREHKNLSFKDESGFVGYVKGVFNRSYRGIDVAAPLLKRLNRLRGGSSAGGGSTLLNIMVKNLYGADGFFLKKANLKKICSPLISWSVTLCRKFIEYRAARDLFPYLAQNNGEEFKRWVSTHAGLVGAVGNGAVYGIQGAAAVVFGKKPEELNRAQQSLLAAAYKEDVRFAHPASPNLEKLEYRNNQWNERKHVAHVMAKRILVRQGNSSLLLALADQFDQLDTPKAPKIPEVLRPYFVGDADDAEKQIKNYANLHTRLRYFMPSFQVLLESDLQRLMKNRANGIPVELVTTLPLQKDFDFRRNIDQVFDKLARRYHFNKNLMFRDKEAREKLESASVRIAVAEINGGVIRYYLREGKHAVEEKYGMVVTPSRPMASLAKIPLATLLVSKGLRPENLLCNRYYQGLTNAGGDKGVRDCSKTFSFEASMARSKNLPLRYAVGEKVAVSQQELTTLFTDFAIKVDGSDPSRKNMIENLSFGRARATAAHMHQIMNKMVALVHTKRGLVQPLHSIQSAQHVIYEGMKRLEPAELRGVDKNDPFPAIGQYFNAPDAQAAMKQLLAAPIYSAGGTLNFAKNLRGGKMVLGKTGTLDTGSGHIKDKYVLGLLNVKEKLYTFSILVGSEDYGNGKGLIKNIKTQALMKPLIQEIIDSLHTE